MRTHRHEKIGAPFVWIKWYDWTLWMLERVDSFPKNQRFIFGQRLADRSIRVLEILVDASYRSQKAALLEEANRQIEVVRWLIRHQWVQWDIGLGSAPLRVAATTTHH